MSWLDALPDETTNPKTQQKTSSNKSQSGEKQNAKRTQNDRKPGQKNDQKNQSEYEAASPKNEKSGKGGKRGNDCKDGIPYDSGIDPAGIDDILIDRKAESEARKRKNAKKEITVPDDDNLDDLFGEAQKAKLQQEIYKAELAGYKSQKEAIELKKKAGDLIETSFAEYLYFGYMERVNLDLLRMAKRIEPMIENMVNDRNTRGIIKRINSEITNILKGIQKQQAEDVKNWRDEL